MFRRAISTTKLGSPSSLSVAATLRNVIRFQSIDATATAAAAAPSNAAGTGAAAVGSASTATPSAVPKPAPTVNNVTLVGVVHDIQTGYVYEDRVTQFVVTTTSIDTTNPAQECVVEKDHHTVRCFGESFAEDVRSRIKEGSVVCVSGRLRLNPQLEPTCGKHFYFPFLHVSPPFGNVALVHGDRRRPPQVQGGPIPIATSSSTSTAAASTAAATPAEPKSSSPAVPAPAAVAAAEPTTPAATATPEPKSNQLSDTPTPAPAAAAEVAPASAAAPANEPKKE